MIHYLLRIRTELYERIKLMAKECNLSINKTIIKLIEIGFITYIKGGMHNENDNKQIDSK